MSELNINDLPREIIIHVLRYLDDRNLNNATLTCKLWKNLIEEACRWSKWNVEFHDRWDDRDDTLSNERMDFILTTERKFAKIVIEYGDLTADDRISKMFERHGFNLVKLYMSGHIHSLTAFAEMLRLTPNLKHVNMAMITFQETDLSDQVLPDLKKLKSLKMYECDYRLIKCFRKAKLSKIIIENDVGSQHVPSCVDFLLTQDMLTSLIFGSFYSAPLILVQMGQLNFPIPFRLTQLAFSNVDDQQSSHDNFLRFVKSQAEHLNHLELEGGIPHSVYECIFASMTKLETLSVVVDGIPKDNEFYERLKENRSVRTIKLLRYSFSNPFLPNFLKKLPNIHSLILPHVYGKTLTMAQSVTMAQSADKVESLSVYYIDQLLIGSVKFPNLHTLQIRTLKSKINWNEFTKSHCRLTELTIWRIDDKGFLTSDDIDQITTNVDLQTIRLGLGFNADDRFFEIIRTKCTNLKVLHLHESCVSGELNTNMGIKVLEFWDHFDLHSKFLSLRNG